MTRQRQREIGWCAWAVAFTCLAGGFLATFPIAGAAGQDAVAPASAPVTPGVAKALPAAPVPLLDSPDDLAGLSSAILTALQVNDYTLLAVGILLLLVWVLRRFGGEKWPCLVTDRGGALLAFGGGCLLALCNAMLADRPLGVAILIEGLVAGATAAGFWSGGKKALAGSGAATVAFMHTVARPVLRCLPGGKPKPPVPPPVPPAF